MKAKNTKQFGRDMDVTRKDTQQEILEIYSIDHDGIDENGSILTYKVVPLRQAQDVLWVALAEQRQDLKEQVMDASGKDENTEIPLKVGSYGLSEVLRRNELRAEIRENIEAIFEKGGEK